MSKDFGFLAAHQFLGQAFKLCCTLHTTLNGIPDYRHSLTGHACQNSATQHVLQGRGYQISEPALIEFLQHCHKNYDKPEFLGKLPAIMYSEEDKTFIVCDFSYSIRTFSSRHYVTFLTRSLIAWLLTLEQVSINSSHENDRGGQLSMCP
eukprot:scaffold38609_cov21-Tisochrysis_lutea.AAC.1